MNHESIATRIIEIIDDVKKSPKTRELSLAVTKLEEGMHWIAADALRADARVPDAKTIEELGQALKSTAERMNAKADELLKGQQP